ncbi:MAG: sensor histidine kinase, partial [Streptococcus sp.]|nr:sensor histidine kinase [Streptococcus sp.]
MALIKKREHSLRTILLSYVVSLTVLSAISSLLILSLFILSYRFGVLFPANQVESDL